MAGETPVALLLMPWRRSTSTLSALDFSSSLSSSFSHYSSAGMNGLVIIDAFTVSFCLFSRWPVAKFCWGTNISWFFSRIIYNSENFSAPMSSSTENSSVDSSDDSNSRYNVLMLSFLSDLHFSTFLEDAMNSAFLLVDILFKVVIILTVYIVTRFLSFKMIMNGCFYIIGIKIWIS